MPFGVIFLFIFPDHAAYLFTLNGPKTVFRQVQHSTYFQTTQLLHYGTLFHMWVCIGIPKFQKYYCSKRISYKHILLFCGEYNFGITAFGLLPD